MALSDRKPGRPREYTDQEILEEIRRLSDGQIGPSKTQFRAKARMSPDAAEYRFGSWSQAVEKAGCAVRKR